MRETSAALLVGLDARSTRERTGCFRKPLRSSSDPTSTTQKPQRSMAGSTALSLDFAGAPDELLDHVVVLSEEHLRRLLWEYIAGPRRHPRQTRSRITLGALNKQSREKGRDLSSCA
jgi:hypothetical protein